MKSSLILLSTIALFSLSLAAVIAPNSNKQYVYPNPPDNCELPSLVSYCLDMMKLGSFYDKEDAGTPALAEIQADVAEVPMGACSWVEYTGTATAQECMQALEEYVGKDYDGVDKVDDEDEQDDDEMTTTDRFLKKLKKKIKKAVEKVKKTVKKGAKKVKKAVKKGAKKVKKTVKKGAKKVKKTVKKGTKKIGKGFAKAGKGVVKGTKKAVKKVAKFCKKNGKFCTKVLEKGFKAIKDGIVVEGQDPNQSQQSQF